MQNTTHRFELHYLDYLLGPFSKNKHKYFDLSPINNVDKISSPIIFFHGNKDKVVKLDQVFKFYQELENKNIEVKFMNFPEEGHGFRDALVNIEVLNNTEKFFNKHLNY